MPVPALAGGAAKPGHARTGVWHEPEHQIGSQADPDGRKAPARVIGAPPQADMPQPQPAVPRVRLGDEIPDNRVAEAVPHTCEQQQHGDVLWRQLRRIRARGRPRVRTSATSSRNGDA